MHFPVSRNTSLNSPCNKLVKKWMNTCLQSHGACQPQTKGFHPTRLVDVSCSSEERDVFLSESHTPESPYVCLSHCWGSSQLISTTRNTIKDRKRGIPWSELSKTFQDAINVTRSLGYLYIWIDSLCIVQDDKNDWELLDLQTPRGSSLGRFSKWTR